MFDRRIFLSLLLIPLIVGITSCNSGRVFHEKHNFSNYQWPVSKKLVFKPQFNKEQLGKEYQFQFNIRYIQGFPYKYLNLLITVTRPDGTQVEKQESIRIRQDNGNYIGDGAGSYWDLDYTIKEAFLFDQTGEYTIEITPIIEESPVYFINELALGIINIEK